MKNKLYLTSFFLLTIVHFSYPQSDEDFDVFFFKFSTDEEFQVSRIKFPLEFETWENPTQIGGNIITKFITEDEWEHDYFYMKENYRPQIYDNYRGELRNTDERLFQWIGIETGINVKYFFKRIQSDWYLIKKENLGD